MMYNLAVDTFLFEKLKLMAVLMVLGDKGMVGDGLRGLLAFLSFFVDCHVTSHSFVLYINLLWLLTLFVKIDGFS